MRCSPRKVDGFFLSVRLEGGVEGPFICSSHCTLDDAANEWTARCLMFDFKIRFNTVLGLVISVLLVKLRLQHTTWFFIVACVMPLKAINSSKESFWVWFFIKKLSHEKKGLHGHGGKDLCSLLHFHLKGSLKHKRSFPSELSISGNTWVSLLSVLRGKKLPTEIGVNF